MKNESVEEMKEVQKYLDEKLETVFAIGKNNNGSHGLCTIKGDSRTIGALLCSVMENSSEAEMMIKEAVKTFDENIDRVRAEKKEGKSGSFEDSQEKVKRKLRKLLELMEED